MDNSKAHDFRVIIAGSRSFTDYALLKSTMDYYLSKTDRPIVIICGKARGADTLGERYAVEKGYAVMPFPTQWDKYGKSAGYRRNVEMADHADALVAFWDGSSPGTKHMIETARNKGLQVRVKRY